MRTRSSASIASTRSSASSIRTLVAKPSYRNILGSIVIYFLVAYGALVFITSLIICVHGLNVAQAGATFGAISAIGAVIGSVGGGAMADRLARRDISWLARFAGWGMLAVIPLYELALWSPNLVMMIPVLFLATVVITCVVAPGYAAIHVVCGSKRRALSVAVVFFFANLLGLGLGPVIAGAVSDEFAVSYGSAEGLRIALMIVMSILLPAGWLMVRAARSLKTDAEA